MSRVVEAAELKALVRALVKAFGGIEAAAIELGISAERVSQFQRPGCPDQMSILCICKLEAVLGRSIVTGALARAADCSAPDLVTTAVVAAVGSSAGALRTIADMDSESPGSPPPCSPPSPGCVHDGGQTDARRPGHPAAPA